MKKKFYCKLIRCLGTYFSIKIFSINQYFFFIIILNFLFFMNLFADFFKFFKCRLFDKICREYTENVCEQ